MEASEGGPGAWSGKTTVEKCLSSLEATPDASRGFEC